VADQRGILTDKNISRLPLATEEQYKVRDSELRGFFVLIGKRRKSFMAQGEFWRDDLDSRTSPRSAHGQSADDSDGCFDASISMLREVMVCAKRRRPRSPACRRR
jgi:hypothetical protein